MCKLINRTTKEDYDKYAKFALLLTDGHVEWDFGGAFGGVNRLRKKFEEDPNLNNISLKKFDGYYALVRRFLYAKGALDRMGFSLAENTCTIKHILIYHVIGAEPVFEEAEMLYGRR